MSNYVCMQTHGHCSIRAYSYLPLYDTIRYLQCSVNKIALKIKCVGWSCDLYYNIRRVVDLFESITILSMDYTSDLSPLLKLIKFLHSKFLYEKNN